jgi:hypothetical protein
MKDVFAQQHIAYQIEPTGVTSVTPKWELNQQIQYGGIAIGTIVSITLLIRSITSLVKACK